MRVNVGQETLNQNEPTKASVQTDLEQVSCNQAQDEQNNTSQTPQEQGELLFEARHNLAKKDYITYCGIVVVVAICLCVYAALQPNTIDLISALLMIACICYIMVRDLFLLSNNRFYITSMGIGFERHTLFASERQFFPFGAVGVARSLAGNLIITRHSVFTLYPLQSSVERTPFGFSIKADKTHKVHVIANKFFIAPQLKDKDFVLKDFLTQRIQEGADGVRVESIGDCVRFALFGRAKE